MATNKETEQVQIEEVNAKPDETKQEEKNEKQTEMLQLTYEPHNKQEPKESVEIPKIENTASYIKNTSEWNSKVQVIYEEYDAFFNDFRVKEATRPVVFGRNDVKELFRIAAFLVQMIRTYLDEKDNNKFKVVAIGGQVKEFLWSFVEKQVNPNPFFENAKKEDAKAFVRDMVKYSLQTANGFVDGVNEDIIDTFMDKHFDELYTIYITNCTELKTVPKIIEKAKELRKIGNEKFMKKQFKEAMEEYEKANRLLNAEDFAKCDAEIIQNEEILVLGNIAACKIQLKDFKGTIPTCFRMLKINPKSIKALLLRGKAYYRLGEHDDAKRDFEKAQTLAPNDPQVKNYLNEYQRYLKAEREREKKIYGRMFGSK